MKAHKITLLVVDFDQLGKDRVLDAIETAKYPNRCISPNVVSCETVDVGDWSDDHPLNHACWQDEFNRLFGGEKAKTTGDSERPYVYHYHMIYQPSNGVLTHGTGTVAREFPIRGHDDWLALKKFLAEFNEFPEDKAVLQSLSLINHPGI